LKIRLERVDGIAAGDPIEARRFPFTLGQAKSCDFQIVAKGVWDTHLILDNAGEKGITATPISDALIMINGVSQGKTVRLKHGDLLGLGAAKLRFWLAPLGQTDRSVSEALIWIALLLLVLGQVAAIAWLLK
jgi:hypothetical protein